MSAIACAIGVSRTKGAKLICKKENASTGQAALHTLSYYYCRAGYYAINPLDWGDWYTDCAPCTNDKLSHSHYTGYSIPSAM
jgi:hypothetical protein